MHIASAELLKSCCCGRRYGVAVHQVFTDQSLQKFFYIFPEITYYNEYSWIWPMIASLTRVNPHDRLDMWHIEDIISAQATETYDENNPQWNHMQLWLQDYIDPSISREVTWELKSGRFV